MNHTNERQESSERRESDGETREKGPQEATPVDASEAPEQNNISLPRGEEAETPVIEQEIVRTEAGTHS
ncbi:MAG: hypothetical protein SFU56_03840 [Capsulimonadales bacterium]|nr:hypothetical protein [Capsulimonadales bacterium]